MMDPTEALLFLSVILNYTQVYSWQFHKVASWTRYDSDPCSLSQAPVGHLLIFTSADFETRIDRTPLPELTVLELDDQ